MDEIKFVVKCFIFAGLLITTSQMQTDGITIESKIEIFLTDSKSAHFMQEAATGGVKFLKEAFAFTKTFIEEKISSTPSTKFIKNKESI